MPLPSLIVFVKNPEAGKVKTRIAAEAGAEKALEIYLNLLDKTRNLALSFCSERWVFYSDKIEDSDEWRQPIFKKAVQQGSDLGERMHAAFRIVYETISENHNKKVLLIGSDCPEISTQILHEATTALDTMDCVVGPAVDGGYYLIGFSVMPDKRIFSDIHWSTSEVFRETIKKITEAAFSFQTLPPLSDIDTLADWYRFLNENEDNNQRDHSQWI